jgi:hypothetical protein
MRFSRRSFILSAIAARPAFRLSPWQTRRVAALEAGFPAGQAQFENPQLIRYDAKCFTVNDKDTVVMSGAFHYTRCPKALWRDRLQKFKLAGFNTIESYVFWNYHEPQEGKANLTEFEDLIKLVQEMGLMMIARPGPYICAEWERGGFPSWVAAKRFPLRTSDPQSLQTSQHWYSEVLPVIQKYQVTVGGPIIMVQVENEYDYSQPIPDVGKREYVRALAKMAWNEGINVPLITCWTRQARENNDPDMARIMDTCNFYPRWKVVSELAPALARLRAEEPASPLAIMELQGGWFSEFGGVLSEKQDGVDAAQIDMITKTALELGVTSFNYYMGFGGTNFDWAAKKLTTTYDYAAPIREPGGLWDKYYAVRGVGLSLRAFGSVLTRAAALPNVQCTNSNVSVTERSNGPSAVLFVRENANAPQRFKMTFTDPHSPSKRFISAPRVGELELAPREMKMLPVQVPVSGGRLCYSTGELLAHGVNLDRDFVILYDAPGRTLEMGLATTDEPKVDGDTAYRFWDPEYETSVLAVQVGATETMLMYNERVQIFVVPRAKALRTFLWEFSPKVVPDSESNKAVVAPVLTDAYALGESGAQKSRAWVDLEFLPGQHEVAVMLPPLPAKCRLDGALTEFRYDRPWHLARFHVTTPALPQQPINLSEGEAWVEKFDPAVGEWLNGRPQALEDLGPVPYGYVKYRASFNYNAEPKMFVSTRADDAKRVFVNGKFVPEASNREKLTEFSLAPYAQPGANVVEIACEVFGAPNFGDKLGELKGLESAGIGADFPSAKGLDTWQIQRTSVLMQGRELGPDFAPASPAATNRKPAESALRPSGVTWTPATFLGGVGSPQAVPAFTWCRAKLTMPPIDPAWKIPWKLNFDADCEALIFLNRRFVGRFATAGPQKAFYLPEPYLSPGAENSITFVLAYTDKPQHVRTLQVAPYQEYSVRKTRIEFEW